MKSYLNMYEVRLNEIEREALYENFEDKGIQSGKKAASEENLRRRRLKNKTEKLFMKKIQGKEAR